MELEYVCGARLSITIPNGSLLFRTICLDIVKERNDTQRNEKKEKTKILVKRMFYSLACKLYNVESAITIERVDRGTSNRTDVPLSNEL